MNEDNIIATPSSGALKEGTMKPWSAATTTVVMAGCAHLATSDAESAPAPVSPETKAAIAAIATYEYGRLREPLTVVEDLVRVSLASEAQRRSVAQELCALLGSPVATHDAKQFVCRQLVLVGGEENVPAIAPLLGDPKTADMARYALQPIPGKAVDEALLAALPTADDRVKIGIVNTLGMRRSRAAKADLQALAKSANPDLAAAATSALEKY